MIPAPQPSATCAVTQPAGGALLDGTAAAAFIGVSKRTWRRWDLGGQGPRGFTIGSRTYWRRLDLERWVAAGCPPARRFRLAAAVGVVTE